MKDLSKLDLDQELLTNNLDVSINYRIDPLDDDSQYLSRFMIDVDGLTYAIASNISSGSSKLVEAFLIVESKAGNNYSIEVNVELENIFTDAIENLLDTENKKYWENEAEENKILNVFG